MPNSNAYVWPQSKLFQSVLLSETRCWYFVENNTRWSYFLWIWFSLLSSIYSQGLSTVSWQGKRDITLISGALVDAEMNNAIDCFGFVCITAFRGFRVSLLMINSVPLTWEIFIQPAFLANYSHPQHSRCKKNSERVPHTVFRHDDFFKIIFKWYSSLCILSLRINGLLSPGKRWKRNEQVNQLILAWD